MSQQILHYVCALAFDSKREKVVLIQKMRPQPMRGKINGPGGKKYPYTESSHRAMRREFREETGVDIAEPDWHIFHQIRFQSGSTVDFLTTATDKILKCKTQPSIDGLESEEVFIEEIEHVFKWPCLWSLRWLVPLAMDDDNGFSLTISNH